MNYLQEDTHNFDMTTYALGISEQEGKISFAPKQKMILSGVKEVKKILLELSLEYTLYKTDGDLVHAGELILESWGDAAALHKAWKASQNLLEYMSGIASYTDAMLKAAQEKQPHISLATTRKHFPGTKSLVLQAVLAGGGVLHRLGTYDSILIFAQHRAFFDSKEALRNEFVKLKNRFAEKKVVVEVESYKEAREFANMGADVLQCERMSCKSLRKSVALKEKFPHLRVMATGGISLENVAGYAECGVDVIVTSAPYHAKPLDVKVTIVKT
ncbi:MAG: ModD protein [Campylobacterales bacterium]|nr:ModD protein [Campylobacterales bacterium]